MLERPRRVVLLIDYDNLQICAARDTPGRDLQLPPVVQLAQRYGTVILARAYAEWNLSTERLAVYKAGIEPAFAPVLRTESDRSGKSLADTVMVAEGMDMLWTLSPEVVVLATSDKDLIPLVRVAKQRGAFVVVLGSDFTAIPLREMADEHFTYRQLVTDASGRFATEAGPGRQPAALPEPSRRRSVRDRTGDRPARDRVGAPAAAAPTPAPARTEREPAQAAASSAPIAAPAAGEPVAPVTAGSAGEDSQVGGRRRRRRGSRRRSDRLGVGNDGTPFADGEGGGTEAPSSAVEITPTTSDVEVAQASSGTVEAEPEVSAAPSEPSEPAAPAPRSRRRTTRRPAAETAAAPPEDASAAPAPAPESEIGMPSSESASSNGAAPTDDAPTPAPRTRPRRVASASRGRTRRA